ncbi:MAG: hypothetical protein ACYDEE_06165 [Ignavibacteriaceae bacterium]
MNGESLKNQLVVFIKPQKFASLFKDVNKTINGYSIAGEERILYLDDNKKIVLIKNDKAQIKQWDEKEVNDSECIIIPDELPNFNYTPNVEFKILYHTNTPPEKLNSLRVSSNYKGELKSLEEGTIDYKKTPYLELAESLENGNILKMIKSVYDNIPEFNYLLEAKLNLLHQCLTPQGAKAANPDWLQGDAITKFNALKNIGGDDPFSKEYIDALTVLRDELLKEF